MLSWGVIFKDMSIERYEYTPQETLLEQEPKTSFRQTLQILSEKIKLAFLTHNINKKNEHIPIENKGDESWEKKGFTLESELRNRQGPFIEIGGPTPNGFELVNYDSLDKKIFMSNITPGCPLYDEMTGQFLGYIGKINFYADGKQLPLKDGGIGALFASNMPYAIRKQLIHEAKRVLEENGLLVWQGGTEEDIQEASRIGFELTEYSKKLYGSVYNWNVIFQKKEEKPMVH